MYLTPTADHTNIADLRATADICEEYNDTTTYLGFCKPGTTDEAAAAWSILKITQSGIVQPITTRFQWAAGLCAFNLAWSLRATYTYKYKNF